MPKKYIRSDEFYSFFDVDEPPSWHNGSDLRDIPQDKLEWIERVMTEFYEVQEYLEGLLEDAERS